MATRCSICNSRWTTNSTGGADSGPTVSAKPAESRSDIPAKFATATAKCKPTISTTIRKSNAKISSILARA